VPSIPNGVIRVRRDGSWTLVADLSAYVRANPVAHPNVDDFEPDGTWYSMIAVDDDALYAVEPNHGEVDRITTHGTISRLIDVSASQGHVVPTVIARRDGNFYLGNLGRFPQDAGSSNIWKITPRGQISLYATGFNMVLGLSFDRRGRMYVLQNSEAPAPAPGTGSVVRLGRDGGHRTVIVVGSLYLQEVHRLSAARAGLVLAPVLLGGIASSALSASILRRYPSRIVVGTAIALCGTALAMIALSTGRSVAALLPWLVLIGLLAPFLGSGGAVAVSVASRVLLTVLEGAAALLTFPLRHRPQESVP